MKNLQEIQAYISKYIEDNIFARSYNPENLYEPIKYVLSTGGKRLRPALVLMAYQLYKTDLGQATGVAVGYEIFHNFTLLHDDIMDNSHVRRNNPTVHVKWDENTAILSGDAMCIMAYEHITKHCPVNVLKSTISLFNKTAMQVCQGQQYDMDFEKRLDVTEDEYLKMIELKTSVLIAACLKTGAIIAKAPDNDAEQLYDFGKNIGVAFQLQDDWLDVFGNFKTFGKKIGNDITNNKKTFLLIKAYEKANEQQKNTLTKLFTENKNNDDKVKQVTAIYNQLEISNQTKIQINNYYQKAIEALKNIEVEDDKKKCLKLFAEKLMVRNK